MEIMTFGNFFGKPLDKLSGKWYTYKVPLIRYGVILALRKLTGRIQKEVYLNGKGIC